MPVAEVVDEPDFSPTEAEVVAIGTSATGVPVVVDPIDALGVGFPANRSELEKELDLVMAVMRTFHRKPADQVMSEVAAFSARCTELMVLLHRREHLDRQWSRVRTMQVTKILEELDRQYKIGSRMVEVQRQDLELMGKGS